MKGGDIRYTFTLAHEIGHAILHAYRKECFRCTHISIMNKDDLFEKEANFFAQYLIMPDFLVKYRFKEYYGADKFKYKVKE